MTSPDDHFCPECFEYCDCADLVCSHCPADPDPDWNDFDDASTHRED